MHDNTAIEVAVQSRNAMPPFLVVILDWMTGNVDAFYKWAILVYALLQIGYLIWRWDKERADRRREKQRACELE